MLTWTDRRKRRNKEGCGLAKLGINFAKSDLYPTLNCLVPKGHISDNYTHFYHINANLEPIPCFGGVANFEMAIFGCYHCNQVIVTDQQPHQSYKQGI